MPQKSSSKNLEHPKPLKFHQIGTPDVQLSKSSPTDRRVLILATPIKLTDGTMKMEQRTIPLRVDNGQLTITATENKNNIVSLKRSIEPSPLALPINQLNKKSPTFVKNEVGQVMGKIIPLGKLSDITGNTLAPIRSAAPATAAATGAKNLKQYLSKPGIKKLIKLEKQDDQGSSAAGGKLKGALRSIRKPNANSGNTGTAPLAIFPKVERVENFPKVEKVEKEAITIVDDKPKKRIHLVWKGTNNTLVGVSQTGTKIKLIPLDDWKRKLDIKLNVPTAPSNDGSTSQPQIVDVRSCSANEMTESGKANINRIKIERDYDREDFDMDEIMEQDPLDICGMQNTEMVKESQKHDVDVKPILEYAKTPHWVHKVHSIRPNLQSASLNKTKITSLAKGMRVELKLAKEIKIESLLSERNEACSKNEMIDAKPDGTVENTANEFDPVISSLPREEIVKKETEEVENTNVDYENIYKRFSINKDNMTTTETAMLSYICNLKKKLSRSQKSRIQAVTALEQREYLGVTNLSNIQKRFIEAQLRNSGRPHKRQRFIKTDVIMARDILKTTGPRGYNNLRKLFALPDVSSVVKRFSKT